MHTYQRRHQPGRNRIFWEVYFDSGAPSGPEVITVLKEFEAEIDAVMFVHILNGGTIHTNAADEVILVNGLLKRGRNP